LESSSQVLLARSWSPAVVSSFSFILIVGAKSSVSGVTVEVDPTVLPSSRSRIVQPSSHLSDALTPSFAPSASLCSVLLSSSISSSQLSSPGKGTLSSLPSLRYLRSPRPVFSFLAFAASEFIRLNAAIDVRSGRGGERRGSRGEGANLGMSEKSSATGGAVAGSCTCEGLGEHGKSGLGNSIGDDVGESDNDDAGSE
jgi:hypothetical protein